MDYKLMTAPCGLDCFNCPVFLAKDNEQIRKIVAEKTSLPFEIAYCEGCNPQKGVMHQFGKTEPCNVYKCITEKGIEMCSDCDEFPCDHLHPYADMATEVPHNTKVFNLCLIKKMGLEEWAKSKAKEVKTTYFNGKWKI